MRHWLPCLILSLAAARVIASPPEAVAAAAKHARTLPPDSARQLRYLDLTHFDADERAAWVKVLSFHLNALSRASDITLPQVIDDKLLAFDLRDYQIDRFVYGRLGEPDPYFHVQVEVADQHGKKTRQTAAAPWLPTEEITDLIQRNQTQVPVLRADWFLYQTAVAKDRRAGYYDFLGLGKKEADFQKLGGANAAEAKRLNLEMAASITQSGVTLHNRGISRIQALTGGYWFTQDFKTNTDKQNTARLFQGDTVPPTGDASEQFIVLPNRLFAYGLFNGNGDRQDTAPDDIASDGQSTSPDRRVHAGLSCIRCHVEGLRPLDDLARKLYRGSVQLRSPDYDKLRKLRQLYLSDFPAQQAADNAAFAAAVKACNGLTTAENANLYRQAWESYADLPVTPAVAARELGVDERRLLTCVRIYMEREAITDPIVAGFAQTPTIPVRREHFEESYQTFQTIIQWRMP